MIVFLSPAKTLDFETPPRVEQYTTPDFLEDAEKIVARLRAYSSAELARLLKVNENLADLNVARYIAWNHASHARPGEAKQAIHAFRGEVYRGLDADTLSVDGLQFAQKHVRILSALYGILRPLDLMLPYRLEMEPSLYRFWGDRIARRLPDADKLLNLASQEYMRAVPTEEITVPMITPIFKERGKNGPRIIGVYAKRQRGRMARYIVDHRLEEPETLKRYNLDGYRYDPSLSSGTEWVYLR